MSFKVYKNEKNLLNYVDFKSWVRTHQQSLQNTLKDHNNREVYRKKFMICLTSMDNYIK